MTRIPDLEHQLVAAAARHYGTRRPVVPWRPALVLTAIAALVGVVVLMGGGGRQAEREATSAATQSTLPAGEPLTARERAVVQSLGVEEEVEDAAFAVRGPDLSALMPTGAPAPERERWVIVPMPDRLCLLVGAPPSAPGVCGPLDVYEKRGMSVLTDGYFKGVAPPEFVSVEVSFGGQAATISTEIINGVWTLPATAPRPVQAPATVVTQDGQVRRFEPRADVDPPGDPVLRLIRADGTSVRR